MTASKLRMTIAFGVVAALTVVSTGWMPSVAVVLVVVGLLTALTMFFRPNMPAVFASLVTVLLVGYAFLDRGFAYLGFPPIFVGELVLISGVLALVAAGNAKRLFKGWAPLALIAFQTVGLVVTIPNLGTYGIDAIRDAVLWGYATFAVCILCLANRSTIEAAANRYGHLIPYFLCVTPVLLAVEQWAPQLIPTSPLTGTPLIDLKFGDVAVHLAGITAFLLLGLQTTQMRTLKSSTMQWGWWVLWLMTFGLISGNRGGMVAILIAMLFVILLNRDSRWGKPLAVVVVVLVIAAGLQIDIDTGESRTISVTEIATSLRSTVIQTGDRSVDGTKQWRLNWWNDIIGYTVFGPYRWLGKGYGVNLADVDGYQVWQDKSLRNPHSVHFTVLARSGIVGLASWFIFLVILGTSLLRHIARAKTDRARRLTIWLLAYGVAFLVNASFDVYLEGPQGGIWFWCLVGMAMVMTHRDADDDATSPLDAGKSQR